MGNALGDPGVESICCVSRTFSLTVRSRSEDVESADALQAAIAHDRLINDTVNATLEETIRGGSDAKTSAWGVAGGAWGGPTIPLFGGIAGGASNASSTAWQNSGRDLSASALSTLSDAVTQSASAVRRLRSTVVQQMAQGETTSAIAGSTETRMRLSYLPIIGAMQ